RRRGRGYFGNELWVRTGRPRAGMPPACPLLQQDATDLTALDRDPQLVGGLDQRIARPHTRLLGGDRRQRAVPPPAATRPARAPPPGWWGPPAPGAPSPGRPSRPVGSWRTKATNWPRSAWS